MSIKVSTYVWDGFPVGGSKMMVMLALSDWCNDEGGSLYPSISRLAEKVRLQNRQVQYILRELEAEGYLAVVANVGGGRHGTTRHYQLNVQMLRSQAEAREAIRTGAVECRGASGCTTRVRSDAPNTLDEPSEVVTTKNGGTEETTTERGGRTHAFEDREF